MTNIHQVRDAAPLLLNALLRILNGCQHDGQTWTRVVMPSAEDLDVAREAVRQATFAKRYVFCVVTRAGEIAGVFTSLDRAEAEACHYPGSRITTEPVIG